MQTKHLLAVLIIYLLSGYASLSQGQSSPSDSSPTPTTLLEVDAKSGPWDWQKGGLNKYYAYGNGRHGPPAVFKGKEGKGLLPGQILSIRYLKGRCRAWPGWSWDPGYDNTNGPEGYQKTDASSYSGNSGEKLPSMFVHPDDWPTFIMALIGAFTDSQGNIVGFPFKVGEQCTLTVPAGATQLQFGLNDDLFGDNSGSFEISITELEQPTPPGEIFNAP